MSRLIKKAILFIFILFTYLQTISSLAQDSSGTLIDRYYAIPPFINQENFVNVLILLQDEARMRWRAYCTDNNGDGICENNFNPDDEYYGYFTPEKNYRFDWDKGEYIESESSARTCPETNSTFPLKKIEIKKIENISEGETSYNFILSYQVLPNSLKIIKNSCEKGDYCYCYDEKDSSKKGTIWCFKKENNGFSSKENLGEIYYQEKKLSLNTQLSKGIYEVSYTYILNGTLTGNCLNYHYMTRVDLIRKIFDGGTPRGCPTNPVSPIQPSPEVCDIRYNLDENSEVDLKSQDFVDWDYRWKKNICPEESSDCIKYYIYPGITVHTKLDENPVLFTIIEKSKRLHTNLRLGLMVYDTACPVIHPNKVYLGDYAEWNNSNNEKYPYENLVTALNANRDLFNSSSDNCYENCTLWDVGNSLAPALVDAYNYITLNHSYFCGFKKPDNYEGNPYYWRIGNSWKLIPCVQNYLLLLTEGFWNLGFSKASNSVNLKASCRLDDTWNDFSSDPTKEAVLLTQGNKISLEDKEVQAKFKKIFVVNTWPSSKYSQNAAENIAFFGDGTKTVDDWESVKFKTCNLSNFTESFKNCKGSLCNLISIDKPNNYYLGNDYKSLKTAILGSFLNILSEASSGTSIGIPSQKKSATSSSISHSVILQALFYPKKKFEESKEINWIGYLYAWWLYNTRVTQNIREDTNRNFSLDILEDKILEWVLDEDGKLTIKAYKSLENGNIDNSTEPLIYSSFDETHPIWEAGENLLNISANDRRIYTHIGNQLIEFKENNWSKFLIENSYENHVFKIPILGLPASCFNPCNYFSKGIYTPWDIFNAFINCVKNHETYYKHLINYVRGIDYPEFRSRKVDGEPPPEDGTDENVWKLGDIIYSTPWVEKYDNYTVTFVGANDGMLHAFRVGHLKRKINPDSPVLIQNSLTDNGTELLGKEIWAFIPQNVLPYLAFLADKNYRHIYTVDLRPYIVHIKQNGKERKILIGGMRLGGAVGINDNSAIHPPFYACPASFWNEMKNWCETCSNLVDLPFIDSKFVCDLIPTPSKDYSSCYGLSSYFALDVTDPENPKFLWEFTNRDLGFTYSGPGIVRINNDKYYVVFGSGPINYSAQFSTNGSGPTMKIFVLDLFSGKLERVIDTGIQKAFAGRIFSEGLDVDNDGLTDYLAFGYTRQDGVNTNYKGGIIFLTGGNEGNKLLPLSGKEPNDWDFKDIRSLGTDIPPVTSKVEFMKCFDRWYMYFGTGRWFAKNDDWEVNQNVLFGIPIETTMENGKVQSIKLITKTQDVTNESHVQNICTDAEHNVIRGWYLRLNREEGNYLKEKVISDPTPTKENIIFFTTIQPTKDPCEFGGHSRVWALNCAIGGSIYSSCEKKYSVSPPKGNLYLQLSGANIVVVNPQKDFETNKSSVSRYTQWYQGIVPESGVPFIEYNKGLTGKLLFWIER